MNVGFGEPLQCFIGKAAPTLDGEVLKAVILLLNTFSAALLALLGAPNRHALEPSAPRLLWVVQFWPMLSKGPPRSNPYGDRLSPSRASRGNTSSQT